MIPPSSRGGFGGMPPTGAEALREPIDTQFQTMPNGSGRSWIRNEFRPAPWRRWSAVGLAPERVAGSVLFQVEHSRVGGPGGQRPDCLAGSGRAQRLQQPGDAWLLVRAERY